MDGGTALAKVLTSGERSFKKEIEKLLLSDGDTFHGEGILELQSGRIEHLTVLQLQIIQVRWDIIDVYNAWSARVLDHSSQEHID